MHGERAPLQTLDQFLLFLKPEKSQMDTISTLTTFQKISLNNKLLPKILDLPLLTLRKIQIPGEMVGLITLVQLSHMVSVKLEEFQIPKLFILTTSRLPSRLSTTLLKQEDKIPSMLKRTLMPGEQDGLQALDQSFHYINILTLMMPTSKEPIPEN